ncbi:MAG: hypothetical protein M9916_12390 [Crocinitomicaceae bacterium]|nr:hypothetical protein [Crocinitomicaceae bacterium]
MELVIISNKQEVTKSRVFAGAILLALLLLVSLITVSTVTDPPVHSELTKEVPVEFLELNFDPTKDQGGSPGGSGKASDEVLNKTNPPQQTGVLTSTDPNATSITTGKSNKTTSDKPSDNTATTSNNTNPIFGGKGGSGGGNDSGSGGVIGNDNGKGGKGNGTGSGDGDGSGKARVRYNEISTSGIYTNSLIKVTLILQVNEDGKVIGTRVVGKETTTSDQSIISKVASACKSQLKYAKGSGVTEEYYHIWIQPQ